MRVSNSKLKTFRRCPKSYEYKYVQRLTPKQRALTLERGSWLHSLLETYYDGDNWKAKHNELTKEFYLLNEEDREELGELPTECARIMRSYLRQYRDDLDRYVVVDSELDEIVTLPNGLKLQIIVDLVVEDKRTKQLWTWDHKTRKNFSDSDTMLIDPQLTLYYFGLERMGYTPMGGVMYNEICTKPPTVPRLLKAGGLSQAKNISTDIYTYMAAIKNHGLDVDDYREILAHIAITSKDKFFRRTYLPKDKPMLRNVVQEMVWTAQDIERAERTRHFPRTLIPQDCRWSCSYKDLCLTELHGGDADPLIRMNFNRRPEKRKDDLPNV